MLYRNSIQVLLALASIVALSTAMGAQEHEASKNGDLATLRFLIESGVDVDSKDDLGRTPLHYAKNGAVAELLVSLGADVNAKAVDDMTPLHYARDAKTAELLLSRGARINARNIINHRFTCGFKRCGHD